MTLEEKIKNWIENDPNRMDALTLASTLDLNDWCIGAGFVRNLVWDKLHDYQSPTPLTDIDLIYFDRSDCSVQKDLALQNQLSMFSGQPWSVKNQARMHVGNTDKPYLSCNHAMSYWPEIETAVGVLINDNGTIEIKSPFGIEKLFQYSITPNPNKGDLEVFNTRVRQKKWLQTWPKLTLMAQLS